MLLHKGSDDDAPARADERAADEGGASIRCPRCGWVPRREDLWSCRCGHIWNTFDTRGVCPACRFAWLQTQCPRCRQWSPHADWYVLEKDGSS
jgi:hypothetical protein